MHFNILHCRTTASAILNRWEYDGNAPGLQWHKLAFKTKSIDIEIAKKKNEFSKSWHPFLSFNRSIGK